MASLENNAIIPCDTEESDKDDTLITNLMLYNNWEKAGVEAGYSESYSKSHLKTNKLQNNEFITRLNDRIRNAYKLLNVESYKLDMGALEILRRNQTKALDGSLDAEELKKAEDRYCYLLSKIAPTHKQIRQAGELTKPDNESGAPVIRIESVKNLMIQAHKDAT